MKKARKTILKTELEEMHHTTGKWVPFDLNDWLLEEPGEYTVTLRVKTKGKKRKKR